MDPDSDARPVGVVAVVAHDAGGAEVLSSHIRRVGLDCRLALSGPACKVFERKLGAQPNMSLHAALHASDGLLCGTSWQSDWELEAISLARSSGKPSVAWLDHWVQYRERFCRAGVARLPDRVWVSDSAALILARRDLPEVPVCLVDNPYFAEIESSLARELPLYAPTPSGLNVLYVCEPVREAALRQFGDALHWGYTEEQALRYFLANIQALGQPVARIVIRPHPSEEAGKYHDLVAAFSLPLSFSQGHTLSAEVASSDCVVGCGSMAMVVGLLGGKRVLSSIPPGGAPCPLPQPQIELLRSLVRVPPSTCA